MKVRQRNQEIRRAKDGIANWMIAERLGVSEQTVLRWLRVEMDAKRRNQILAIIQSLKKELGGLEK